MSLPDDDVLAEDYYRCDDSALEQLYGRHTPVLKKQMRRCGLSRRDTEDLVHEVWVRLMGTKDDPARQGARYDPRKGSFGAWIGQVARNLRRDWYRRSVREVPVGDPGETLPDLSDGRPFPLEDVAETKAWQEVIQDCLQRLPPKERRALEQWMREATLKDLAEDLETSVPTAHRIFWRAVEALKECLRKKGVL